MEFKRNGIYVAVERVEYGMVRTKVVEVGEKVRLDDIGETHLGIVNPFNLSWEHPQADYGGIPKEVFAESFKQYGA